MERMEKPTEVKAESGGGGADLSMERSGSANGKGDTGESGDASGGGGAGGMISPESLEAQ